MYNVFILKQKEKKKKKKRKEKREKNGFDLGSPGSYYGKKYTKLNLITCINPLSYLQY